LLKSPVPFYINLQEKKNVFFNWGPDQLKAFNKLNEWFTSAPIFFFFFFFLRNPDSNKSFVVETDASNFAVDAILSQELRWSTTTTPHSLYLVLALTKSEKELSNLR